METEWSGELPEGELSNATGLICRFPLRPGINQGCGTMDPAHIGILACSRSLAPKREREGRLRINNNNQQPDRVRVVMCIGRGSRFREVLFSSGLSPDHARARCAIGGTYAHTLSLRALVQ